MSKLHDELKEFRGKERIRNIGALCVVLVVTRFAKKLGLPLAAKDLVTKGGGQVLGLNKAAVQSILASHGISRVLAEEGGRTNRGSMGQMTSYVECLNRLHREGLADLNAIESWWIERVKEHFEAKGFTLNFDSSKSLRYIVDDLLSQAVKRQKESSGTMYAGAVLQHLVGAKLAIMLGDEIVSRHGFSAIHPPSCPLWTAPVRLKRAF